MHWDFVLILAVLGALVPWLGRRRLLYLVELSGTSQSDRLALCASTIAFQRVAAIVFWRATARGISLKELCLTIPRPMLIATTAALLCVPFFANQGSLKRMASRPIERLWTASLVPSLAAHCVTDLTVRIPSPIRLRTARITGEATEANSNAVGFTIHSERGS
jgi:hypothetical protein